MSKIKRESDLRQTLLVTASQIRLAQFWSQSAIGIFVLSLIVFLWSVGLLNFNFLFFTDKNRGLLLWLSIIIGILSLVFGLITFIGSQYAKKEMLALLGRLENHH